jgi:glycerate dehydrogenase
MSMKIVVLDAKPLDVGDMDWTPLNALGDVTRHPNTAPGQTIERVRDAQAIFSNKVFVGAAEMGAAPELKFIGVLATGYNNVDIEAARQRGITVCNVPGYGTNFVAQTTIALLLELCQRVGAHDAAIRAGQWQREGAFSFWNGPLVDLEGKTLLIIGLGAIGKRVAQIANALGLNVIAAQLPGRNRDDSFPRLPLEEALPLADVISLHCPLTPQTQELINTQTLRLFKPSALLINTARGLLVNDHDLAFALQNGQLAGYAADVLSAEPPPENHPLLHAPNCILTPHFSWASPESRQRLLNIAIENLRRFLQGTPQNVVK